MSSEIFVYIGLAIVVVSTIILAYYSVRTWHAAQVFLVCSIVLFSILFLYLTACTLKLQQHYHQQAEKRGRALERVLMENEQLQFGDQGVRQLRHALHTQTLDRGRVWRDAKKGEVRGDGATVVAVVQPDPHGIETETLVFVFEQGAPAETANYLGEFTVEAADQGIITLVPTMKLSPREQELIASSETLWSLYEIMPVDRHELFQDLTEAELEQFIPVASRQEYFRHGKSSHPEDPPERVVDDRYVRQLRSYEFLFHELHRQRVLTQDAIEQATLEAEHLKTTLQKANQDISMRTTEVEQLQSDLNMFERERAAIAMHLVNLKKQHTYLESELNSVLNNNRKLASQLAQHQHRLGNLIDGRTRVEPAPGAVNLE